MGRRRRCRQREGQRSRSTRRFRRRFPSSPVRPPTVGAPAPRSCWPSGRPAGMWSGWRGSCTGSRGVIRRCATGRRLRLVCCKSWRRTVRGSLSGWGRGVRGSGCAIRCSMCGLLLSCGPSSTTQRGLLDDVRCHGLTHDGAPCHYALAVMSTSAHAHEIQDRTIREIVVEALSRGCWSLVRQGNGHLKLVHASGEGCWLSTTRRASSGRGARNLKASIARIERA